MLHSIIAHQYILAHFRRINAIMTTIQGGNELGEYGPYKRFIRILIVRLQILNDLAQISSIAVFHVEVHILCRLEVLAMKVTNNIWMS